VDWRGETYPSFEALVQPLERLVGKAPARDFHPLFNAGFPAVLGVSEQSAECTKVLAAFRATPKSPRTNS